MGFLTRLNIKWVVQSQNVTRSFKISDLGNEINCTISIYVAKQNLKKVLFI